MRRGEIDVPHAGYVDRTDERLQGGAQGMIVRALRGSPTVM
jgi:hypothetical protein